MDCVSGKYPAPAALNKLAPYFEWSSQIEMVTRRFIEQFIGHDQPLVAVQWRQEFAKRTQNSGKCSGFSVSQCAPYIERPPGVAPGAGGRNHFPSEVCAPTLDSMRTLLDATLAAAGPSAKLFVASDASMAELGELGDLFGEFGAVTLSGGE